MYNSIIIGMGISGVSCAIYLKRAGLNVLVLEGAVPGGIINEIPKIENYPGIKEIAGPDLAGNLFDSIKSLNIDYKLESVKDVIFGDVKKVITNKGEYTCKNLVIASGRRPRMLGIPHEEEYLGKGISTCALCDGNFFKNKDVIVVGGGSSALTESLYLANIVNKVTVIHRRDEIRAENILEEEVRNKNNIELITNRTVKELIISDDTIKGVILDNGEKIEAAGIFLAVGYIPNTEFLKDNIVLDNGYIVVDENYETNIKGVYACGDVIKKDIYQIVTAASEGASVGVNIAKNK